MYVFFLELQRFSPMHRKPVLNPPIRFRYVVPIFRFDAEIKLEVRNINIPFGFFGLFCNIGRCREDVNDATDILCYAASDWSMKFTYPINDKISCLALVPREMR